MQKSVRYWGAWPFRQLCTMTLSMYLTRSGTSSQCSSLCSSRDKPRSYFFIPLTTQAAALSTRSSLSVVTSQIESSDCVTHCCMLLWLCVVRATGLLCLLGISVGLGSVFIYRLYTNLFRYTDAKRRRHISDLSSSVKSATGNGNLPGTLDVSTSF